MKAKILFNTPPDNLLKLKRVLLFCIENKCMSGFISNVDDLGSKTVITVDFIDPFYFKGIIQIGKSIELREASIVLKTGEIINYWQDA